MLPEGPWELTAKTKEESRFEASLVDALDGIKMVVSLVLGGYADTSRMYDNFYMSITRRQISIGDIDALRLKLDEIAT